MFPSSATYPSATLFPGSSVPAPPAPVLDIDLLSATITPANYGGTIERSS